MAKSIKVWSLKYRTVRACSRRVGRNTQLELRCPGCKEKHWVWYSNAYVSREWRCTDCAQNVTRLTLGVKWHGKLTPVEIIKKGADGSRTVYRFKCECGGQIVSAAHNCIGSCGCLKREACARNRPPPKPLGVAAANHLWHVYRSSAKKRKLAFDLTKEQFLAKTSNVCFYCGASPKMKVHQPKHHRFNGDYLYNGLDRRNNSLGYTETNTVPCCRHCNRAKDTMTENTFITLANRIARLHPVNTLNE